MATLYRQTENWFTRRRRWLVLAIIALYVVLALGRALTTQPWNDEAWYSSPSLSLIRYGNTGTPLLETAGKFWKGINQRTYWVPPLQFYVQVPWFKLFGFSLLTARLHAMAWGLVALLSWGQIVRLLTKDSVMALLAMLLFACDYQFVSQTALGRMDAMALALASMAILLYLELRERSLGWAILASQMAVVACGLTHPTAGVPAFAALLFLTLYCDVRRIRWTHFAIATLPYMLGLAFLAWYIGPAADLFRAQFFGNVASLDRLGGLVNPLRTLFREAGRYAGMAGFEAGMNPLYRIKILVILIYAVSVISLLADGDARRDSGVKTLLWIWAVYFLCMTFYENTKEVKYAIHIVAIYDALAAVWIVRWWRVGAFHQVAAAGCALLFVSTGIGGLLYASLVKDDYHHSFLPAATFLKRTTTPKDLILGPSEFGFALGFDRNIVDDDTFTYDSHKVPDFIVIGKWYQALIDYYRTARPNVYEHIDRLERNYRLVYSQAGYKIFERRDRAPPLAGRGPGYAYARSPQRSSWIFPICAPSGGH